MRSGVTAAVPGNGTRSKEGWAGGNGSAAGASHCSRQLPPGGVPSKSSPCITPTCSRLAGSTSEVGAPRTRAPSAAASPQPESLIEGGVASIMPMKRKDIPALLVSTISRARHHAATAIGSAHRSSCGPPLPKGRSFPPGTSCTELGPPRRPAPPEAFRASGRSRLRAGGRSKPLQPRPGP
jgi:hypothetical protein